MSFNAIRELKLSRKFPNLQYTIVLAFSKKLTTALHTLTIRLFGNLSIIVLFVFHSC